MMKYFLFFMQKYTLIMSGVELLEGMCQLSCKRRVDQVSETVQGVIVCLTWNNLTAVANSTVKPWFILLN